MNKKTKVNEDVLQFAKDIIVRRSNFKALDCSHINCDECFLNKCDCVNIGLMTELELAEAYIALVGENQSVNSIMREREFEQTARIMKQLKRTDEEQESEDFEEEEIAKKSELVLIDEIIKGGIVAGEDIANNIVCVFIKDIEDEQVVGIMFKKDYIDSLPGTSIKRKIAIAMLQDSVSNKRVSEQFFTMEFWEDIIVGRLLKEKRIDINCKLV